MSDPSTEPTDPAGRSVESQHPNETVQPSDESVPPGDSAPADDVPEPPSNAELAAELDEIKKQVAGIINYLEEAPGGKWTWPLLTSRERQKLWGELHAWVIWLDQRYLQHLSREKYPFSLTWYRHPVAVELLTALMVSHKAVYNKTARRASAAMVDWHERCLFPTLDRIRDLGLFPDDATRTDWPGPTPRSLPDAGYPAFTEFVHNDIIPATSDPMKREE